MTNMEVLLASVAGLGLFMGAMYLVIKTVKAAWKH